MCDRKGVLNIQYIRKIPPLLENNNCVMTNTFYHRDISTDFNEKRYKLPY